MKAESYDVAVVGGGPAGLAAALAVGRMNRRAVVLEAGTPRTAHAPCYHNLLGFPEGISGERLLEVGRTHAERWGAVILPAAVTRGVTTNGVGRDRFRLETTEGAVAAAGVILATGVKDRQPSCGPLYAEIGRGIHYCAICDGRGTAGETVAVVGRDAHAVAMVDALRDFTDDLHLLLDEDDGELPRADRKKLEEWGVRVVPGCLEEVACEEGRVRFSRPAGGPIEFPHVFLALGVVPRTDVAESLGCALDDEGYVTVELPGMESSVDFVHAAGDCAAGLKQVTQAMAEGERAAIALCRALRETDGPARAGD